MSELSERDKKFASGDSNVPRETQRYIRGAILQSYASTSRAIGIDPYSMMRRAGLPVQALDNPDAQISADRFRELARKRFLEEGRDPDDEQALGLAIARERKNWIRSRLTDLGVAKAKDWGWPNIDTYTKSLGEQLVAAAEGVVRAIVRPAIVESAVEFPFPGWNEGFTYCRYSLDTSQQPGNWGDVGLGNGF